MIPNGKTETQVLYFTNSGTPATGLSPTFTSYKDVTDPSNPINVTQPTIYEIGNGLYGFTPIASSDKTIAYNVDGGASISDDGERYISGVISWGEFPIADVSNLDVPVSSRLAAADYVEPDNQSILLIKNETDKIQPQIIDVPDNYKADVSNLALESTAQSVKNQTDKINFDENNYIKSHLMVSDVELTISETDKADIVDKVWDESISGHTTIGTFGATNQKAVPSENVDDYKADLTTINFPKYEGADNNAIYLILKILKDMKKNYETDVEILIDIIINNAKIIKNMLETEKGEDENRIENIKKEIVKYLTNGVDKKDNDVFDIEGL